MIAIIHTLEDREDQISPTYAMDHQELNIN